MQFINAKNAPKAIGPYSQAIIHHDMVFTSGQIALIPETMKITEGGIEAQTAQVLKNLDEVLAEAGSSKDKVIKTTIFLKDMEDFHIVNKIYSDFFGEHKPARSTVQVSRLPKDVLVEIDVIAKI